MKAATIGLCAGIVVFLAAACGQPSGPSVGPSPSAPASEGTHPPPPGSVPTSTNDPTATGAEQTAICLSGGPWTLRFEWSGGFAGVARSLDINSAGEARALDLSQGIEIAFLISAPNLASLETQIRSVCPTWRPERPPPCADCFDYSVRFEAEGRSVEYQANDVNLNQSPTGLLVESLQSLVVSALSGTPSPGG